MGDDSREFIKLLKQVKEPLAETDLYDYETGKFARIQGDQEDSIDRAIHQEHENAVITPEERSIADVRPGIIKPCTDRGPYKYVHIDDEDGTRSLMREVPKGHKCVGEIECSTTTDCQPEVYSIEANIEDYPMTSGIMPVIKRQESPVADFNLDGQLDLEETEEDWYE